MTVSGQLKTILPDGAKYHYNIAHICKRGVKIKMEERKNPQHAHCGHKQGVRWGVAQIWLQTQFLWFWWI